MADVIHPFWISRGMDPGRGGSLRHELVGTLGSGGGAPHICKLACGLEAQALVAFA